MKWASLLFSLGVALMPPPLSAQLPALPGSADEKQPEKPSDPYGRTTPRSTFLNFVTAVQRQNLDVAAHYLQMPATFSKERQERAVSQLHFVLDRAFRGDIDKISRLETGSLTDGLPPELELAGTIPANGEHVEVLLVRAQTPEGPIWQISAETLAQIPRLYMQLGSRDIENRLPRWLVENSVFRMPLWIFLAAVLLIPVAYGLGALIVTALVQVYRRVRHTVAPGPVATRDLRPYVFITAILLHFAAVSWLGLPLLYRQYYSRFIGLLVIFGFGWLLFHAIDRIGARLANELANRGSAQSAFLLAKRIIKAIVFLALVLVALQQLGINVGPALATLGIGGLAVAFAAQKSLENLFGGISVLSDRAIRVGDYVRIGTLAGTVEDIGLRSTRIRTLERTVVSVPNGLLSSQNLENFALRDMFWFHPILNLRYETTPDQLRAVLADLRTMLYSHSKVRQDGARVRLIEFGGSSLDIEIFSYVEAVDFNEFLAIKEDLMLRIMDIIHAAGTGFAFPSQTVYLARDSGLDKEQSQKAEERIRQMADRQQLPFPDYTKEQMERVRGSIEFPPRSSVLRQQ
jgi:MscS family membrane protein